MNRQERRKKERIQQWISSLPNDKTLAISNMITYKVAEFTDKLNKAVATAITNILIDKFGFTLKQAISVIDSSNKDMMETYNFLIKEGDDYMKKLEGKEKELDKRIAELIQQGYKKTEGIKILKKEFNITNAIAGVQWTKVKGSNPELQKQVLKNLNAVPVAKESKIKEPAKKENVKEEKKVEFKNDKGDVIEMSKESIKLSGEETIVKTNDGKPFVKISEDQKTESNLFVSQELQIKELKGTYKGIDFIKDSTGVTVGEEHFKDISDLTSYANAEIKKFNDRVSIISQMFNIG